jgi:hypothetical protein
MNHEQIFHEYWNFNPKFRTTASESLLLANCPRPVSMEGLKATAARITDRLAVNGDYAKAFAELWQKYPEYELDANESVLVSNLRGDEVTIETLSELMANPSVVKHLAKNQAFHIAERAIADRQRLIDEIASGKESYCVWDKSHGQARWYKVTDLNDESDATVLEVHGLVMEYRRLAGTPISELRKQERPDDVFLAHPDHPEREYAPAELKKLQRHEFRRLLFTDSGQSKPGVSEAITRILKGQV